MYHSMFFSPFWLYEFSYVGKNINAFRNRYYIAKGRVFVSWHCNKHKKGLLGSLAGFSGWIDKDGGTYVYFISGRA